MPRYRKVAVGDDTPNAVTVGIERNGEGKLLVPVWWPSHDDVDADETEYSSVPEALAAAEAARELHGFSEVVVTLQSDDLWDPAWGELTDGVTLDDAESYELAYATEAMRDA